jgi:uncharacterized protein YlxW (UPF0749 family)
VRPAQELLQEEKTRSLALAEELKGEQKKTEDYETRIAADKGLDSLKAELDDAKLYAGLTEVKGNGVIITLDDSKKRIAEGVDPNDTVIHDWQLAEIVNILREAGAQAISINDERIISTSEIQCAGPTVSINHVRFAVPFVVKAIGNADYLEAKLKEPGNVLDLMNVYNIEIDIKKNEEVVIPKYNDVYENKGNTLEAGGKS